MLTERFMHGSSRLLAGRSIKQAFLSFQAASGSNSIAGVDANMDAARSSMPLVRKKLLGMWGTYRFVLSAGTGWEMQPKSNAPSMRRVPTEQPEELACALY